MLASAFNKEFNEPGYFRVHVADGISPGGMLAADLPKCRKDSDQMCLRSTQFSRRVAYYGVHAAAKHLTAQSVAQD